MQAQSLNQDDPLEKEMATHYSILPWKIPWKEEPGGLHPVRSRRVGPNGADTHTHARTHARMRAHTHTHSIQHLKGFYSVFSFPQSYLRLFYNLWIKSL